MGGAVVAVMVALTLSTGTAQATLRGHPAPGFLARLANIDVQLDESGGTDAPPFDLAMQPAMTAMPDGTSVLYYGLQGPEGEYDQTWVWDGVERTWTNLEADVRPGQRFGSAAAVGSTTAGGPATLLYGGCPETGGCPMDVDVKADTWAFDGARWTEVCSTCAPSVRLGHMMASNGDVTMLFGGVTTTQNGLVAVNDLWTFTGSDWVQVNPAGTPPPARFDAGFAWDGTQFVLFGGSGADLYGDTWTLRDVSGTWTWSQACDSTTCGPGAREVGALAGISTSLRPFSAGAVLVGGNGFNAENYSDVWYWNGTSRRWRLLRTLAPPSSDLTTPGVAYRPTAASLPGLTGVVVVAGLYQTSTTAYANVTAQVSGRR